MAISSAAGSDQKILPIADFRAGTSIESWKPQHLATVAHEDGRMKLVQPKYLGGDLAWPRVERDVTEWDFASFNGLSIDVENPTGVSQGFDVVLVDGRGASAYLSVPIAPRTREKLKLRFEDAYKDIDWSDVRTMMFMRTQPDVDYVWYFREVSLFLDQPERTPAAEVRELLEDAGNAFGRAGSLMGPERRQETRQQLEGWHQRIRTAGGLRGRLAACRDALSGILAESTRVLASRDAAEQADPSLLMWSVAPGHTFCPMQTMTQYRQPADKLRIHAARGEYGDAILRLTNMTSDT